MSKITKTKIDSQSDPQPTFMLTADDILSGGDSPNKPLEVPQLTRDGKTGMVYLKPLPAGEVMNFSDLKDDSDERNESLIRLVAMAVVNQDGEPLFTDEQVSKLRDSPVNIFAHLMWAVMEMNGLGSRSKVEESLKNASTATTG